MIYLLSPVTRRQVVNDVDQNRTIRMVLPHSKPRFARHLRTSALITGAVLVSVLAAACSTGGSTAGGSQFGFKEAKQVKNSTITVWVDATRLPAAQAFEKANPSIKIKIVSYDGAANGSNSFKTKMQLFDRAKKGWPDVVWSTQDNDSAWASQSTAGSQPFAAQLNAGLVPSATLAGFAKGALDPCTVNGKVYCLRNDLAQNVLWYNKTLMDQWGYKVPTTWEQYQALGEEVAKQHPGYVIGAVGDTNSQESYFWSSQCPAQQLVANNTLKVDLSSPDCTRMASLLDPLIADKSVSTQGFFTQGFNGSKVLMAVGPSWYGQYLFNSAFKTPARQIAAAAPLQWTGQSQTYTGNVGGGIWMVSSHSKNLKAATALASYMTTSNQVLASAPTYPAYVPGAKAWLANPVNKNYFADDVTNVFLAAANEVWTGWAFTSFSDATPWSNAVLPQLTAGKSLTDTLPAWQTAIVNEAKASGYSVVTQ